MNVVLGPAPCRECGRAVTFNGKDWVEPRPKGYAWVHVCPQGSTSDPWVRDRMANIMNHRRRRAS